MDADGLGAMAKRSAAMPVLWEKTCPRLRLGYGTPREGLFASHLLGKRELLATVLTKGAYKVVQLIAEQIQPSQAGDDPLLGSSVVAIGLDDLDVVIFLVAAGDFLCACEHKPAPP